MAGKIIEVMPRRRKVTRGGHVRWELQRYAINVDRDEIVFNAAKFIAKYVRQKLDVTPQVWRGLAQFVKRLVRVKEKSWIAYPTSRAIERLRADAEVGLSKPLLDKIIEDYLEHVFVIQRRRRIIEKDEGE